jgi:hypothetical protein
MLTKERLGELASAKKQVTDGSLVIWNARLEALINAGDLRGALDQLVSPVERGADNCDCGNNCKCGSAIEEALGGLVQPPASAAGRSKG